MFEGWKGVVILVACITILGGLAALKVDGAAVAAIGAVQGLVLYFVRSMKDPPLPPSAKVIPFVFVGALALDAASGCAALTGDKAAQAENAYKTQQLACVAQYETRDLIEACRQKVREEWGIVETATSKDGGR